jgi:flavin-dependent dehydrogenase
VTRDDAHDVVVIGGGPAGSTTAGFLARAGLRVALFEREPFPRFHVGESLLPALLPLLDRLGAHDAVRARGFQVKYGAQFHDQETGREHTFYFAQGKPWPDHAYEVPRAEFDALLLDHARKQGVDVFQPAAVETADFDAAGVTVTGAGPEGPFRARARMLVDASGRDGFLARRLGRSERVPNLGKVALFAHFQGAERAPGRAEGNIRIYIFEDGWFWWIPFAGDTTSVGCVMHARTVRSRAGGSLEAVYEEMIGRCHRVARGLEGARRITPVHRVSNFAYVNRPVIGDRFVTVGDAVAFVDPIFSGGVYIAMQSGELAAQAIVAAFRDGRFEAARFRAYERAVWRGITPFFRMIHRYYEPAFMELFLNPRNYFGMVDAVLSVLAGGVFLHQPWRTRVALGLLFGLARLNTWVRRVTGRPYESRLEW